MFLVCVWPPLCLIAYVLYACCVIWALQPAINFRSFIRSFHCYFWLSEIAGTIFWYASYTVIILYGKSNSNNNCFMMTLMLIYDLHSVELKSSKRVPETGKNCCYDTSLRENNTRSKSRRRYFGLVCLLVAAAQQQPVVGYTATVLPFRPMRFSFNIYMHKYDCMHIFYSKSTFCSNFCFADGLKQECIVFLSKHP